MKVCTDACLFGAWVANKLVQNKITAKNILDIGCGTGLLSLMLAQKTNAVIDSVEIDASAFDQAKQNISLSSWKEKIQLYHNSINNFEPLTRYDFIICNPPFYEDQLKSKDESRNTAMHSSSLSFAELVAAIKLHLCITGTAALLLPYSIVDKFEELLNKEKLFIFEKLNVKHSPHHPFFRTCILVSNKEIISSENSLSIKGADQFYTFEFVELLKDYYLNL